MEAQGGDPAVWTDPGALPSAPVRIDVVAPAAGWVGAIPAHAVGEIARWLGAGRLHADQSIDPVAGLEIVAVVGQRVGEGDPIAVIHSRDDWAGERARQMAAECITVSPDPVERGPSLIGEGGGDAGAA